MGGQEGTGRRERKETQVTPCRSRSHAVPPLRVRPCQDSIYKDVDYFCLCDCIHVVYHLFPLAQGLFCFVFVFFFYKIVDV